jgi:ABC-2 type transport system permease protein
VLPQWLQPIAWALPSSHVFEGMRAVMIENVFRSDLLLSAMGLNAIYILAGAATFLAAHRAARRGGLLLQVGE